MNWTFFILGVISMVIAFYNLNIPQYPEPFNWKMFTGLFFAYISGILIFLSF